MLIEQIIEFELRGSVPHGRTFTPISGYFHEKTIICKKIFDGLLFTAKILHEAMYPTSP